MIQHNIQSQDTTNILTSHEFKNKDESTKKNNEANSANKEHSAAELTEFYDTKSDPNIQPIDPKTDPANQIKISGEN